MARWTRWCPLVAAALLAAALLACGGEEERSGPPAPSPGEPVEQLAIEEPHAEEPDASVAVDAAVPPDAHTRTARQREGSGLFDPREDDAILRALREEEIVAVERGRGGRSLAFRISLANGARAYFKPEQTFSGTHWYAEIAAFHLDRALELHRTAPATGRSIPWAMLAPAAEGDPRVPEIVVGEDGMVRGAAIAWMEGRLVPIQPPEGWQDTLRSSATLGPSPFVAIRELRAAERAASMDAGVADAASPEAGPIETGPDAAGSGDDGWEDEARAAELSDLVVFDFLSHNGDRWGGGFTNVRTLGVGGPLVYLDNGAGFSRRRARLTVLDARLAFVERFHAQTLRRLQRLEIARYAERLASDPLAPILDERQLEHLEERRVAAVVHIEALVAERGRDAVLPW